MGNKITKSKNNSIKNNNIDNNIDYNNIDDNNIDNNIDDNNIDDNNIDDNVFECIICFNKIINSDDIKKTVCNHSFCKNCLNHWLENNSCCPLCRKKFNGNNNNNGNDINRYYKVHTLENTFEGYLIDIYFNSLTGITCYTFINIQNSKYPIGDRVFVFDNLSTMYQI
jgi:hypothetical protein